MKNRKQPMIYIVFILVAIVILVVSIFINNFSRKAKMAMADFSYLQQENPNWGSYYELQNEIIDLSKNWTKKGQKQTEDDYTQKVYIQKEFDRQTIEIQRIFETEKGLKRTELNGVFQDFSKKHSQQLDKELKQKSQVLSNLLFNELQQKKLEVADRLKKYRRDLETEQKLTLVNLQLQLAIVDFKTDQTEIKTKKAQILAAIFNIKQEINLKGEMEQTRVFNELTNFEKLRREQTDFELKRLKDNLQTSFQNDLAEFRAKLELEFIEWQEQQEQKYKEAIQIRADQREK